MSALHRLLTVLAGLLARAGVIEETRLRETTDLAWPRILTGFAIMSKRTVDLAVVGLAIGPTAVAGLTVANAYWTVGKFAFIGLSGGTIALVSQNYGGGDSTRAARAVEASLIVATVASLPLVVLFVFGARPLVELLGNDARTLTYGATYLAVVAPGLVFEALNLVASRTYAGVGDTLTPMALRATGAVLNIVLSAGLVLGLGYGVAGAAIGTTLSTVFVAVAFAWGMSGRAYLPRQGVSGASPIPVRFDARPDRDLFRQLLSIATPLVARRIAQAAVVFPLLALAAVFGPLVVAAIGVARQVRALLDSFGWGFSIATSTLVGQSLGRGDEATAAAYGWEITKLSCLVYVSVAVLVLGFAEPIARVFVDGEGVATTTRFVRVAAVSVVALGIDGSVTGTLRGAGDTRVPFLATLGGLYLVALPLAWLGTVTAWGVLGLMAALVAETFVPMVVNYARFRAGTWKAVSRGYRPDQGERVGQD
ncbi:MATE family efflux transporter [Salinigranum halophilum]|uniref:MATE family efflux transporter n=1 Tax=Salinigranum halophilum TaxID=2565931 RepID=UPI00115D7235|nr:MATE family efflux transporter [Salinigranum halophilum]